MNVIIVFQIVFGGLVLGYLVQRGVEALRPAPLDAERPVFRNRYKARA